jgi:hypothetical protein
LEPTDNFALESSDENNSIQNDNQTQNKIDVKLNYFSFKVFKNNPFSSEKGFPYFNNSYEVYDLSIKESPK